MEDKKEKYIQGKLSQEEHESFEKELTADESKEMAFELGVRKGVEEVVSKDLREKVAQFEHRRSTSGIRPWQLGIAASILLIASFTYLFTRGSQDLYSNYYEPYPNFEVTALRGADGEALIIQAYKAYDEQNYVLASEKFEEHLETNKEDVASRFFYGITLMENGEFNSAITNFGAVIEDDSRDYLNAAKWYAALCYLSIDDANAAISLLDQLADSEEFGQKAKSLKEEL